MSTEVATTTANTLAIREDQSFWTDHQLAGLQHLGVEDAPHGDLELFFHQCQRTGLDPFARQIYMIGRQVSENVGGQWIKTTKYTIQTGIDGFRLVGRRAADATGHRIEISDTEWCDPDGKWHDVWMWSRPPVAARVAVLRDGGRFPAIALYEEYVQRKRDGDPTKMWAERGAGQLAKCAEALAWRKAFPQDLSGLYTVDEMAQSTNDVQHHAEQVQKDAMPVDEHAEARNGLLRRLAAVVDDPGAISAWWTETHGDDIRTTTKLDILAQLVEDAEARKTAPAEPEQHDEDREVKMVTQHQQRKMRAMLNEVGITDRDDILAFAGDEIGRTLESSADMTHAEAETVIASVQKLIDMNKETQK